MTALSSYSTGTVAVTAGGTTVTGTGTNWTGVNAKPGDTLQIGNFQTVVIDVTNATTLVIPPWGGTTVSGVAYSLWKVSPQRYAGGEAMMSVSDLVAALNTKGLFVYVSAAETVPDPSYGEDGQFALQTSTGKMWEKTGGAWVYVGTFRGFGTAAPWNSGTAYKEFDIATLNGSSYICILAHTNHTPPNGTYWALLASKGDTGATGPQGAGYIATSTTSLTIGTGSKVFTTQAGLAYSVGARVRASSVANSANYMEGLVTAYSGTSLTVNMTRTGGSGTIASWNLNVAGDPGSGDLLSSNNLSDVASAATARINLGIRQTVALASSADLNTALLAGDYYTVDSSSTNAPLSGKFWYLNVDVYGAFPTTYVRQIATNLDATSNAETYFRILRSGSWQAWRKVQFADAADSAAACSAISPDVAGRTTAGMLGYGVSIARIAPLYGTRLKVTFDGTLLNTGVGEVTTCNMRVGTGSGPAYGASVTGTVLGNSQEVGNGGAVFQPGFSLTRIVTGLTPGTTYWFDLAMSLTGGTAYFKGVTFTAKEE